MELYRDNEQNEQRGRGRYNSAVVSFVAFLCFCCQTSQQQTTEVITNLWHVLVLYGGTGTTLYWCD